MKKSTGVPKKSPRKRHKKKRLKNRKRSLRQRLARLSTTQQALAAIRPATSGQPAAESEPERSLPAPARGRPLWEVTVNSVDAPQFFGLQQLPKISDPVTIRLPRPATPLTVDAVYRHSWALQPSSWGVLVLSRAKPCEPPPELTTKLPRLLLAFLSTPLTIVMPQWPPSKPPPEQPPEQPRTQNEPSLPALPLSTRPVRKVGSLKELTLAVIAGDTAGGEECLPFDGREESVHDEFAFRKRLRKTECKLRQATKPFRKKAGFIRKAYQPDKNQLSRKSIGSLKRERLGLSGSHQPRRHVMPPRLSRTAGKALLSKKHFKLLAPEVKQPSELFTPVPAAELRMRQPSSSSYSAVKVHLKPEKAALITDNATREEQLPADDREDNVHYTFIFREHLPATEPLRKEEQLRTQNEPSLTGFPPSARPVRKVGSLKELTLAVIADHANGEEQAPAGNRREDHGPYKPVLIKRLKETKIKLSKDTKNFSKKSFFISKAYRPDKNRLSRKSIGSLKKQRTGLSSSHQPSRYATKIPRLSRAAGRALLTKRFKLLAPEIKQHSEIVTPVPAAELRMRQPSSSSYSAVKVHLKPEKAALIVLSNMK